MYVVGLMLSEEEILNCTLVLIENILRTKNSSLNNWDTMPKPAESSQSFTENLLIQEELNYPKAELRSQHDEWIVKLTDEQRSIYDQIIGAVLNRQGGVFFCLRLWRDRKNFFVEYLISCYSITR